MEERGWDQVDFAYVIGDAYVDHPSFGTAIITRLLESRGYKVGIIAQPDWRDEASIREFGEPRLAFLVSAGNMDSMVNHYTVSKKRRSTDAYSPGGKMGLRPDRAVIVYGNLIRRAYKKTPVILGGIEDVRRHDRLSPRGESSLTLAYRNAKRMLSLINQLLDFRKIVKNKMELKISRVDLVPVVEDAIEDFREMAAERHIELLFTVSRRSILVWVDIERMESVIEHIFKDV